MKKRTDLNSYLIAFFVVTLINVAPTAAQSMKPGKEMRTTGAFYALSVEHFEEMVSWYTTHLHFSIESQSENDQRKGALLTRPGVLLEIASFNSAQSRQSLGKEVESHELYGIFKLGFLVEDIDSVFQQLTGQGEVDLFFSVVTASDGTRTFGIKDPEGNIIQFFGD